MDSSIGDPDRAGILLLKNPGSSFSCSRKRGLNCSVSLVPGFFLLTSGGLAGVVKIELSSKSTIPGISAGSSSPS